MTVDSIGSQELVNSRVGDALTPLIYCWLLWPECRSWWLCL